MRTPAQLLAAATLLTLTAGALSAAMVVQILPLGTRVDVDPVTVVLEVRRLARLETASLTTQRIVRASRGEGVLWGALEESLLLVATGEVIAGVDLARLDEDNVWVDLDGTTQVVLPAPEVWVVDLDEAHTWVADRDRGWLASVDPHLETLARREAERVLRSEAVREGLLDEARLGAETAVGDLIRTLGARQVQVTTRGASAS